MEREQRAVRVRRLWSRLRRTLRAVAWWGVRRPRQVFAVAAAALMGGVVVLVGANQLVLRSAERKIETVIGRLPDAQAALVLGSRVYPDGTLSPVTEDRVRGGADLYHAGKVDKVLVSGDHGQEAYNEVGAMRDRLLALGVPAADIFCDHAGFNTWNSAVRARKVFQVTSAIVVTQEFHLPRAVYLAGQAGIDATGYAADRRDYGTRGEVNTVREWLARVRAVADAVTNRRPRYLGPPIPIEGDGRASWDDLGV